MALWAASCRADVEALARAIQYTLVSHCQLRPPGAAMRWTQWWINFRGLQSRCVESFYLTWLFIFSFLDRLSRAISRVAICLGLLPSVWECLPP